MSSNPRDKSSARGAVRKQPAEPRRRISVKTLGYSLVVVGMLSLLGWLARQPVALEVAWPGEIARVSVSGELTYIPEQSVVDALQQFMGYPLVVAPLQEIKEHLEAISWVDQVVVKREFPDTLAVFLTAQKPVARWGENGLVNHRGEVFLVGSTSEEFATLPMLVGERSHVQVLMSTFNDVAALFADSEHEVAELAVDARSSWRLVLQSGVEVVLGRESLLEGLERFLKVYAVTAQGGVAGNRYDVRYANGVAVR